MQEIQILIFHMILNAIATWMIYPYKDVDRINAFLFNINGVCILYYAIRITDVSINA